MQDSLLLSVLSSFRCRSSQMQLEDYSFSGVHPSVFLYFLIPFLNNKIPERIIIGSNLYANKQCQDDSRSCSEKIFFLFFISFFLCSAEASKRKNMKKSYENFILVNQDLLFFLLLACSSRSRFLLIFLVFREFLLKATQKEAGNME